MCDRHKLDPETEDAMPRKKQATHPGPPLADISPMLLSEAGRDVSGDDWLWELKYDGYRLLAEWGSASVALKSRNGANASAWFPEVGEGLSTLKHGRCIVDGEVCVLDDIGRPDFDKLHRRAQTRKFQPGADMVVYCVFDLLAFEGQSIMHLPLVERKALLATLWQPAPSCTLYVQHVEAEQGAWLYEQALALELEGLVAKQRGAVYLPSERTPDWVKRKRPGAIPPSRFSRKAPPAPK